jgi:hypothetical protein
MTNELSQQLFTEDEFKKNSLLREELFKLISSGEAILFVGSGLSMSVGFPSWDKLLRDLENLALRVGTGFTADDKLRIEDPLAYADKIKKHFYDNSQLSRYNNELHSLFARKTPNFKDFHKKLVRLPFSLVLTTNYDTVLSDALLQVQIENGVTADPDLCFAVNDETRPLVSKFLSALHKSLNFPKKVAHLHGYFSRQNEIILTKSDYERCYNPPLNGSNHDQFKPSLHFLVLWSLMATRRIVFFGFGMKDPYLIRLLENVCSELWQWERPTHINVTNIESETAADSKAYAEMLREKFGVDTYFCENTGNNHQQLESLINEIHEKCFPSEMQTPITNPPELTQEKKDGETAITESGLLSHEAAGSMDGTISEWLLSANKKLDVGITNEDK